MEARTKRTDIMEVANPDRLESYLDDMRLLDPDYELPLIDFWNPAIVDQMRNVVLVRDEPMCLRGEIGPFTVLYSRGRSIPVQLEIKDTASGRRLRQDGEDRAPILGLLMQRWKNENT